MPPEPLDKRAVAFVDGQNLFYAARDAFGYSYPNYDPKALAAKVCEKRGWRLTQTRFYTGIPNPNADPRRHGFWTRKMAVMGTRGIVTYSRQLSYTTKLIEIPGGGTKPILLGREKGIDIRIALDVVRLALDMHYDVGLIFSQDQDMTEVADEVRYISKRQRRWIKIACAFPVGPTSPNTRGIDKTDWIRIDRATYDACLDPNDYRPKMRTTGGP